MSDRPLISLSVLNNVNCKVIILEHLGNCSYLVADTTASIYADIAFKFIDFITIGDIVELRGYSCKLINGQLKLRFSDLSTVYKVGEFTMLFKAIPNKSST